MSANALILCPADPFASPDREAITGGLSTEGFLGEGLQEEGFFKPGEAFFRFLTFMGCSPVVALGEPGVTAEVCRIEIPPPLTEPRFLAGLNLKQPRCPRCGYRAEGRPMGEAWQRNPLQPWGCPGCGRELLVTQWQWRHSAGFGRFFLKVWGVFEGEAVPSEQLMRLLEDLGGGTWDAFYLQK